MILFLENMGPGELLLLLIVLVLILGPGAARQAGRAVGRFARGGAAPRSGGAGAQASSAVAVASSLDAYFKTLDLPSNATLEQVRQAYKDLAKVWHPDRFAHDPKLVQRANLKMQEINAAYEQLVKAMGK
ncbi:MAG TPA: J domain-containing protein [Planctomycetota bacterium]|jgi:DnaJ-domain-containing protein 1